MLLSIALFSNIYSLLAQEDINPAVLNSISISNENIQAGDDLTFILNMTDDISGIRYAYIQYENSYGEQNSGLIGGNISSSWTNLGDNNYSITTKLNEYAASGEWYIRSVSIMDNANNYSYNNYFSADQSILTFNVVSEEADINPAVLNSISISNENIQAGDDLTFILNMTDDISGIRYAYIQYENSYGEQNSGLIGGNISSSWTNLGDNNYSITTKLNEYAASGEWYIRSVSIMDNANNYSYNNYFSADQSILTFNVIDYLSIKDILFDNILIYPNPATNKLFIKGLSDVTEISIYDALAKLVLSKKTSNEIDVTNLKKGMYTIKIVAEQKEAVQKFIKY